MNPKPAKQIRKASNETLTSEFLILPDGRILAHSLSPMMAEVLKVLNPADKAIRRRAGCSGPELERDCAESQSQQLQPCCGRSATQPHSDSGFQPGTWNLATDVTKPKSKIS